jgi:hypothetical protein
MTQEEFILSVMTSLIAAVVFYCVENILSYRRKKKKEKEIASSFGSRIHYSYVEFKEKIEERICNINDIIQKINNNIYPPIPFKYNSSSTPNINYIKNNSIIIKETFINYNKRRNIINNEDCEKVVNQLIGLIVRFENNDDKLISLVNLFNLKLQMLNLTQILNEINVILTDNNVILHSVNNMCDNKPFTCYRCAYVDNKENIVCPKCNI